MVWNGLPVVGVEDATVPLLELLSSVFVLLTSLFEFEVRLAFDTVSVSGDGDTTTTGEGEGDGETIEAL